MYLVLDLDDTIIPSSRLYESALEATFGSDSSWRDIYQTARYQVKDVLPKTHVAGRNRLLYFKRYLELRGHRSVSALDIYNRYENELISAIGLWSRSHGRFELLRELSEHVPLYILTNENTRTQFAKLHALTHGEIGIFSGVLTSEEVGVEKPHPRIFEELMRRFGIPSNNCLMVGDSLENDVRPARRLGMQAVLTREFVSPDDQDEPGISTLSDLAETLIR